MATASQVGALTPNEPPPVLELCRPRPFSMVYLYLLLVLLLMISCIPHIDKRPGVYRWDLHLSAALLVTALSVLWHPWTARVLHHRLEDLPCLARLHHPRSILGDL